MLLIGVDNLCSVVWTEGRQKLFFIYNQSSTLIKCFPSQKCVNEKSSFVYVQIRLNSVFFTTSIVKYLT